MIDQKEFEKIIQKQIEENLTLTEQEILDLQSYAMEKYRWKISETFILHNAGLNKLTFDEMIKLIDLIATQKFDEANALTRKAARR